MLLLRAQSTKGSLPSVFLPIRVLFRSSLSVCTQARYAMCEAEQFVIRRQDDLSQAVAAYVFSCDSQNCRQTLTDEPKQMYCSFRAFCCLLYFRGYPKFSEKVDLLSKVSEDTPGLPMVSRTSPGGFRGHQNVSMKTVIRFNIL